MAYETKRISEYVTEPGNAVTEDILSTVDIDYVAERAFRGSTVVVGSPTGNDYNAITAAVLSLSEGGTVLLGPGEYTTSQPILWPPDVALVGSGVDATTLKVAGTGYNAIGFHAGSRRGCGMARDITIEGYGDVVPSQGTDADRLFKFGPFDRAIVQNCRFIYSRYVSVTLDATDILVIGNVVQYSYRDGIQANAAVSAKIINNVISEVADDGIAVHVASNYTGVVEKRIIVTGNTLTKCTGIKLLGARNSIVSNNSLRFCYGYGIFIGLDVAFGEGYATPFSILVQNNSITDTIPLSYVNGENGVAVIYLTETRSKGGGSSAIAEYPETYNPATGLFVLPDPYINVAGADNPRAPSQGILVSGNVIKNTLSGLSVFSDSGFGDLWWVNGGFDPAMGSNIPLAGGALLRGVMLEGDADGFVIEGNRIEGVSESVLFRNFSVLQNTLVANNSIRRCTNGVTVDVPSVRDVGLSVSGNLIDLDPFYEASGSFGRTSPINGTWAAVGGSNYMGVTVTSTRGAVISGNRFRNCLEVVHRGGGQVSSFFDNIVEMDWSGATLRGVGSLSEERGNVVLFRNSDPTSVDYGKYSTTADSGFVVSATAQPSTGYYRAGQIVRNTAPSLNGSGRYLYGWLRLTNSNANVAGVDWLQMWMSNATWA